MIRQAIIPLAGLGTRLLPLTSVFAKELLPMNGKAGIEYILDECIDAGIKEVVFIISKKKWASAHFVILTIYSIFSEKKTIFQVYNLNKDDLSVFSQENSPFFVGFLPKWP